MPDLVIGLILTALVIVVWVQAIRGILGKKKHKHPLRSGMFNNCHSDPEED